MKKTGGENYLMNETGESKGLFDEISGLIEQARRKVATAINGEMVVLYWNIGRVVKEEIMKSGRAEYGKQIVQSLTAQLTQQYGRGFFHTKFMVYDSII